MDRLTGIRVASPCHARWEEMEGDEKVRFCAACRLHVYNLSAMDVEEAAERIAQDDDRLCVRFYRRLDGTVLTRDCPVGVEAKRRKRGAVLNTAAATAFGFGLAGMVCMPTMGAYDRPASRLANFHSAAKAGDVERLRARLDRGMQPDSAYPDGRTPLMRAALNGHLKAVRLLLSRGANVNAKDREGHTALQLAREGGHPRVASLLRKAGGTE